MSYLDFYLLGVAYVFLKFGWSHRNEGWPAWLFGFICAPAWPAFTIAWALNWAWIHRPVLPFRK